MPSRERGRVGSQWSLPCHKATAGQRSLGWLRWKPSGGPSRSTMCRAAAISWRAHQGPIIQVPCVEVSSSCRCLIRGWRVRAGQEGPPAAHHSSYEGCLRPDGAGIAGFHPCCGMRCWTSANMDSLQMQLKALEKSRALSQWMTADAKWCG